MAASRGDFERPLGLLLSLHLAEIYLVAARALEDFPEVYRGRLEIAAAAEELDDLAQVFNPEHQDTFA